MASSSSTARIPDSVIPTKEMKDLTLDSNKMVTLISSDNIPFQVEERVILQSETIKGMIEEGCVGVTIPVINVTSEIMENVVDYLKKHVNDGKFGVDKDELKKWDEEFVGGMDRMEIFNTIAAANFLNIRNLLDFLCQFLADYIKNMEIEEIREIFGIENDFTPEEMDKIKEENLWAFQD